METILYTVAKSETGELVRAVDAEKGGIFHCPICSGVMHLRKSGNTGPNSKRPHFYHKSLTPNCTPETALHFAFKNLVVEKINAALERKDPLLFSWRCLHCADTHSGNLSKLASAAHLEKQVGQFIPDISLVDNKSRVLAVIEVVVTHPPDSKALAYYKKMKIPVIQIDIISDSDLDRVEEKLANPDKVTVCPSRPICKSCGNYKQETRMTIVEAECDRCRKPVKVAMIRKTFTTLGPNRFTVNQLSIARAEGAHLVVHSWYKGKENLINACRCCGKEIDRDLFSHYYSPAECGSLPSKSVLLGYHCSHCFEKDFYLIS